MSYKSRNDKRIAFVLASTDIGTMIVSRLDYNANRTTGQLSTGGPGAVLLELAEYEPLERDCGIGILQGLAQTRGPGVVAIDAGANCGAFTVPWAKTMQGWGTILAIEPQRHIHYALCGNLALNNIFNVVAIHGALGEHTGTMDMPLMNYQEPWQTGGLSLLENPPESMLDTVGEAIGKEKIKVISIDSLKLPRLDMIKLDIEGMEPEAIGGSQETIARCRPVIVAEHLICTQGVIKHLLPDYEFIDAGINTICVPKGDKLFEVVKFHKVEEKPVVQQAEPQVELLADA